MTKVDTYRYEKHDSLVIRKVLVFKPNDSNLKKMTLKGDSISK